MNHGGQEYSARLVPYTIPLTLPPRGGGELIATGEDYVLASCPDVSLSLRPLANAEARLRLPMARLGGEGNPFTPVISEAKFPPESRPFLSAG